MCTIGSHCSSSGQKITITAIAPTPSPSFDSPNIVKNVGNPCTSYFEGVCEVCTGDCDSDADCALGLRCADRDAGDIVPGCTFAEGSNDQASGTDYCKYKEVTFSQHQSP